MLPKKLVRLICACVAVTVFIYVWNYVKTSTQNRGGTPMKNRMSVEMRFPLIVKQQDWQTVNTGSNTHMAIYSAYSSMDDHGASTEVTIVGIMKKKSKEEIYCQYHFHESSGSDVELTNDAKLFQGTVEIIKPGSEGFYAGVFIRCPLPQTENENGLKPEMVSVIANGKVKPSNKLQIQYQVEGKTTRYQYNFSVCVKPTFNFNEVLPLLEWIEFYKLMGVQQFTLYNMTIGPEASCILRDFMDGGDPSIKINVLPWTNHHILHSSQITGKNNVPQYSIAAAQNDCVHRHRGHNSKYMVYVDLDEFIMPREEKAKNYQEMITLLDSQNPGKTIGEYQFRNAFFIMSRPDDPALHKRCSPYRGDPLTHHICLNSLLLAKVTREDYYPFRSRTKYIIRPEGVKQASNHYVYAFEKGFTSLKVWEGIAFSRHYRHFEESDHAEKDGVLQEFGHNLVDSLSKRVEGLMRKCNFNLDVNE